MKLSFKGVLKHGDSRAANIYEGGEREMEKEDGGKVRAFGHLVIHGYYGMVSSRGLQDLLPRDWVYKGG